MHERHGPRDLLKKHKYGRFVDMQVDIQTKRESIPPRLMVLALHENRHRQ
jgi:hypothetical protein